MLSILPDAFFQSRACATVLGRLRILLIDREAMLLRMFVCVQENLAANIRHRFYDGFLSQVAFSFEREEMTKTFPPNPNYSRVIKIMDTREP
jgi:hypothetical protein